MMSGPAAAFACSTASRSVRLASATGAPSALVLTVRVAASPDCAARPAPSAANAAVTPRLGAVGAAVVRVLRRAETRRGRRLERGSFVSIPLPQNSGNLFYK